MPFNLPPPNNIKYVLYRRVGLRDTSGRADELYDMSINQECYSGQDEF